MSSCKVTLYGLYHYLDIQNKDLFAKLELPESVDKDVLINNILDRGGEFEVLNLDPDYNVNRIGYWSSKWARTFKKWDEALATEYGPLWNYDRTEEWTTTDNGHSSSTGTSTDTSHSEGNGTTDTKVSAFNSNNLVNDSQDGAVNEADTTGTTTMTNTGSNDNTNIRKGRAFGNIGIMSSQSLLMEELTVSTWNLIDHITDIFLQEFTIMVYE